jgi:hypothetical protein
MTPELWRRVKEVFVAALERPLSERAAFLDAACRGDPSLREEVESLFAADDGESRFDTLPRSHSRLRSALAGRYRLERELGRGGMAMVFLAHDLKHDRPVALKVMHPELSATIGAARFEREIRLAARLQHPNILPVYDSGESAGLVWFTMPHVAGESLRDLLSREKQLSLAQAVRIVREVAEALHHAHQHGIVHRDVKPENILLGDGHALVADFGIARSLDGAEPELTRTGIAVGTPAYMSPEQASGSRDVDARTDVYALGCILFELLAGEPPYTGQTPQTIFTRALTEPVPQIHRVRSDLPPAVHDVIAKAMAATPADRHATAREFAGAVDLAVAAGPEHARRTDHPVFGPRPLLAGLVIGVLIGVGALFAWRNSQSGAGRPEQRYIASGEGDLTWILLSSRRYREAAQAADRSLAFAPTDLRVVAERAIIALAQGDLAGARAVIRRVPKEVDTATLLAFFAAHWDLYWVLDETQQASLFQLTPAAWDGNRGLWAYTLAETSWLRGDLEGTLAYADSARIALVPQIETAPQDPRLHVLNGVALAYLGRKAEAIREGEQAVSLVPISNDARSGTSIRYGLARIYTLAGEPEKAIGQLEALLEIPFYLSPGWLKIDPNFDALRSYPRFGRLVSGS